MMNRKGQDWCFEGSEVVEIKPSLYRVFIKKIAPSIDLKNIKDLATKTLKLKRGEAAILCDSLTNRGEWLLGTYQADLAETIMQDLSTLITTHGLELGISPLRE